ncbi:hypothetical protein [Ramlibacter sp. AN1133]|uniref:hypothetical protein n=1 Tax=Ramlibacter sp. AN1133 TaxID=3133429 RepID=UPI0030BBD1CC
MTSPAVNDMPSSTITISVNASFQLSVTDAPATLAKLLALFPQPGVAAVEQQLPGLAKAGAVLKSIAEANGKLMREGTVPDRGWGGVKDIHGAINKLPGETRRVVLKAIENGGQISRAEVYEVLGRPADQSLKGFTKPVNRLMEQLQEQQELEEDAEALLTPVYDSTSRTYQKAQGFTVPLQVVKMLRDRAAS